MKSDTPKLRVGQSVGMGYQGGNTQQLFFLRPSTSSGVTFPASPNWLFEATFTRTFSRASAPTARHDYNQILYRLDVETLNVADREAPTGESLHEPGSGDPPSSGVADVQARRVHVGSGFGQPRL